MASVTNKTLIIIAAVLALVGFAVALGGVAKLTDMCNEATSNQDKMGCGRAYQYEWWGVWFTFILVVILLIMTVLGKVDAWVSTVQSFCAACLSVTMVDCWQSISRGANAMGDYESASDAATAGFVLISAALMLLIIFVGMGGAGVSVQVSVSTSGSAPARSSVAPASEPKNGNVIKVVSQDV